MVVVVLGPSLSKIGRLGGWGWKNGLDCLPTPFPIPRWMARSPWHPGTPGLCPGNAALFSSKLSVANNRNFLAASWDTGR